MRRTVVIRCAAALLVGAATTGCAAESAAGPSGKHARPGSGETRELTDTEKILVQRAEQTLIKKCMGDAGFKYWTGPLPTVDELNGGGFVLTDPDWAKRNGYGSRLQQKLQETQRDDPNHAYLNALPQQERVRYSRTLEGGPSSVLLTAELPEGGSVRTPREGCQAKAKEQLYGDFERWFQAEKTATNLTPLYVSDLLDDKRFVNALAKWSACMRISGHAYADPPEIRRKLPEITRSLSADKAYAVEVELATTEATCATTTPLSDIARILEDEYRAPVLERYSDAVADYKHMSLAALARAKEITGSQT
jgi:hypothetical protein